MYFTANPILIAAAVLPAAVLLYGVYKTDRLEKEPLRLLFGLLLVGILATSLASVTERIGIGYLSARFSETDLLYRILLYFVVVGCSEEGFKYLLLRRVSWNNPNFNCQFDGVVYAVFVSLGFALWENINYVLSFGLTTALLRALTAVPGHACFGVAMGVCYGIARRYHNYGQPDKCRLWRRLAFAIPALLHGCYDFIASSSSGRFNAAWLFAVFVLLLFGGSFIMMKRLAAGDCYIYGGGDVDA